MINQKKKLIIIDSNSVLHRAYHALPSLTTKKGEVVNALYGFLLVFFKVIKEFRPEYIVACFDFPAPTFRHKEFKDYKAKRPPTPPDLKEQIPKIKDVLKVFNVPIFEKEGFEADDLIGTIAYLAKEKKEFVETEAIIISGDLDLLQLVDSQTKVFLLRKGVKDTVLYDEEKVKEKYSGLKPEQISDFKALKGDSSDNLSGIVGIGEKTTIDLLKKFENLENLFKEIEQQSKKAKELSPKLKILLSKEKEKAFFFKTLTEIEKNIPLDFNQEKCRWKEYDKEKATKVLEDFEFHSLIKRLPEIDQNLDSGPKSSNLCFPF